MANLITLDGETVDIADPHAYLPFLQKIEAKLLAGQTVVRAKLGSDDVTYNEASLPRLEAKIAQLEKLVAKQSGRRTRQAARVRLS